MTDITALPALLARVEAATGPDRAIDGAIEAAFLPKTASGWLPWPTNGGYILTPTGGKPSPGCGQFEVAENYTTSLDATVALVEKCLKHAATIHLTINIGAAQHDCAIDLAENEDPGHAVTCRTPPLALLAALLRSMIEEEGR